MPAEILPLSRKDSIANELLRLAQQLFDGTLSELAVAVKLRAVQKRLREKHNDNG